MPIEVAIWNVADTQTRRVEYSSIDSEKRLEGILDKDISVLGDDYLVIGRQVKTKFGKYIDLLAMDQEGKISVIELKKNKTPRDVIAQAIDYASWIQGLSYSEVAEIYHEYAKEEFEPSFEQCFGAAPPDEINQEHDIVIVCSELDKETERIINYLSENYNVPINVVFLRFFTDKGSDYLTRSWLIDPAKVEEKSSKTGAGGKSEEWNGNDFVANVDVDGNNVSTWEDAVKYGFVSAGGGKWYSRTLKQLFPGARVFAMRPSFGYVGVGTVTEEIQPIKKFKDAFWETGLRANQNSVFKLRNKFTLDRLIRFFDLEE